MRDHLPEDAQDIYGKTINYNLQKGEAIGLCNEKMGYQKSVATSDIEK